MLKKVSKNTVAAQVINQLTALIRDGKIKPGEKLPSEREMAAQLGVSRPPLREAIRVLEYTDILETRYGQGIYVKNTEIPMESDSVFSRLISQYTIEELIEMRQVVELATVRLATERATAEDLEHLKAIQKRTEKSVGDMEAFIACDFEFHSAIAEATGNAMMLKTVQMVRWLMEQFNRELLLKEDFQIGVCKQHAEVLENLSKRDPGSAVAAMEKHLDNVVNLALEQWSHGQDKQKEKPGILRRT